MKFQITTLFVVMSMVQSEERFCLEDSLCPDDFFCELATRTCHECLDCTQLHRSLPPITGKCVKTAEDCGPCFEGWRPRPMKYGKLLYGTRCEASEVRKMQFWIKEIYLLFIGASVVAGILITTAFLRIFRNIIIF